MALLEDFKSGRLKAKLIKENRVKIKKMEKITAKSDN
jgi:hypothetical protein